MTSLVENPSPADFKAAMETAERLTSILGSYGSGDDGTTNSHSSTDAPLIALDDDLWKELYLLPTPPLSPDCLSTTDSNSTPEEVSDAGEGMYLNMLEYDQMMDVLEEAERALSDSQQSFQQDLLLQDCMWSGGHCDGTKLMLNAVNSAVTNATSGVADTTLCCDSNDGQPCSVDDNSGNQTEPEPDCVEPAAVFPALRTSASESGKSLSKIPACRRPALLTSRSHSLSSSESEEEIDVVTVERLPDKTLSTNPSKSTSSGVRHVNASSTKKQILCSSRHSSSMNSPLRKKRHTKRLSRRASEDGMESDEEARRASHNVLERKRRNDLKNSFDILRSGIPELEENLRAPKVVILRKAVEYIQTLQTTDQKTKVDFTKEQARHKKLVEQLAYLRNQATEL